MWSLSKYVKCFILALIDVSYIISSTMVTSLTGIIIETERLIQERIDRAMATERWCDLFQNNAVFHILKTHSDHHPMLTCCLRIDTKRRTRPFRFEKAWLMHGNCKELVVQIWQQEHGVILAIETVPDVLISWYKEKFGNITYKKRKL